MAQFDAAIGRRGDSLESPHHLLHCDIVAFRCAMKADERVEDDEADAVVGDEFRHRGDELPIESDVAIAIERRNAGAAGDLLSKKQLPFELRGLDVVAQANRGDAALDFVLRVLAVPIGYLHGAVAWRRPDQPSAEAHLDGIAND
jgi:hypothetical protein